MLNSTKISEMVICLPVSALAVDLDDFFVYDPVSLTWTNLSSNVRGDPPFAREAHGFTSMGGKLYLHGGWNRNRIQNGCMLENTRCMCKRQSNTQRKGSGTGGQTDRWTNKKTVP